jgi:hypothetical protein
VHAGRLRFLDAPYFRNAEPSSGRLRMLAGAGINGR